MVWQHIRVALLVGAVASALALTAWADEKKIEGPKDGPKDPPKVETPKETPKEVIPGPIVEVPAGPIVQAPIAPAPIASGCSDCGGGGCGQQFRTVCVEEWVPETYTACRTVYKRECRTETYTAYRTECVPETRTRNVCVSHMVPECRDVVHTYCVKVPVTEERTCYETRHRCVQVTEYVCKTKDMGHYECREEQCGPSFKEKMTKHFHHKKDCCECACECAPVHTKTVKVWVPCMVTEQVPVCRTKRICEQVPVTKCVTTYRNETRTEVKHVTSYRCVTEQKCETYTVNTSRCVPYQATRTVNVCVPVQETYTATRCVKHTVQKQIPVETSCASPCGDCGCEEGGKHHKKLFHK